MTHDNDLEFLENLRRVDNNELRMLLRWQACEAWRRVAIEREMARRGLR